MTFLCALCAFAVNKINPFLGYEKSFCRDRFCHTQSVYYGQVEVTGREKELEMKVNGDEVSVSIKQGAFGETGQNTSGEDYVLRSYIISREVDGKSVSLDAELESLQKKYDFDLDVENYAL
jgi:hypothetical protein